MSLPLTLRPLGVIYRWLIGHHPSQGHGPALARAEVTRRLVRIEGRVRREEEQEPFVMGEGSPCGMLASGVGERLASESGPHYSRPG